jgi:putative acetyltransferase
VAEAKRDRFEAADPTDGTTARVETELAEEYERSYPGRGRTRVTAVLARRTAGEVAAALWFPRADRPAGWLAWEAIPRAGRRVVLWYLDPARRSVESLLAMLDAFEADDPLRGPAFLVPDDLPGILWEAQGPTFEAADRVHFDHVRVTFPPDAEVPAAPLGRAWRIRHPTPEDGPALIQIASRAYRDYPGRLAWTTLDLERDITDYYARVLPQLHQTLPSATFVAEVGGGVRGNVVVSRKASGPYIDSIQVDPRWHGRGLGRALLVHALAALRAEAPRDPIDLTYLRQNERAGALYRSVGFVPAAEPRVAWAGYWARRKSLRALLEPGAGANDP